eukprot:13608298-Ditylum_brightwellii.AAC.1
MEEYETLDEENEIMQEAMAMQQQLSRTNSTENNCYDTVQGDICGVVGYTPPHATNDVADQRKEDTTVALPNPFLINGENSVEEIFQQLRLWLKRKPSEESSDDEESFHKDTDSNSNYPPSYNLGYECDHANTGAYWEQNDEPRNTPQRLRTPLAA